MQSDALLNAPVNLLGISITSNDFSNHQHDQMELADRLNELRCQKCLLTFGRPILRFACTLGVPDHWFAVL